MRYSFVVKPNVFGDPRMYLKCEKATMCAIPLEHDGGW